MEFKDVPRKASKEKELKAKASQVLGLEAKLVARSTEDDKIFDANVEVIYKQMNNFCGSVKTNLGLIMNQQKERRDEVESIVRKLVICCCGNKVSEDNAEEGGDLINIDDKDDMATSGDVIDDSGTSDDAKKNSDTLFTAADNSDTSGEDKDNTDTCGDAKYDSGVSCFEPIDLDNEPEAFIDSPTFTPRKSIRERRPSVNLRDYSVPRKALEIHQGQKDHHLEKKDDHSTKKRDGKHKGRKTLVQKLVLNPNLKRGFPCEICAKRFKSHRRLRRHLKSHMDQSTEDTNNKKKICYTCGQFFPNKELFNLHRIEMHGENPKENPEQL